MPRSRRVSYLPIWPGNDELVELRIAITAPILDYLPMSYPSGDPNKPYDPNFPSGAEPYPSQPYGDQSYGAPGYQAQPYGQGYGIPQDHPQSTVILILGILGIVLCAICAPFAWIMGKKALKEIDASGGAIGGRGQVMAGYIMGIIGTALIAIGLLVAIGIILLAVLSST